MPIGQSQLRQERVEAQQKATKRKTKKRRKAKKKQQTKARAEQFPPCVYAIAMGPFVKVGYTRGDVRARLNDLQTGSPLPLELVGVFEHRQPHRLEQFVHAMLADVRAAGEWFVCEVDAVEAAVAVAGELRAGATWDEWRELSRGAAGVELGVGWRDRRRLSKAALVAARGRKAELVEVFEEWLDDSERGVTRR